MAQNGAPFFVLTMEPGSASTHEVGSAGDKSAGDKWSMCDLKVELDVLEEEHSLSRKCDPHPRATRSEPYPRASRSKAARMDDVGSAGVDDAGSAGVGAAALSSSMGLTGDVESKPSSTADTWPGWSRVCVGGDMEVVRAKNGSEIWAQYHGEQYFITVGESPPNGWKPASQHPLYDSVEGFGDLWMFPS